MRSLIFVLIASMLVGCSSLDSSSSSLSSESKSILALLDKLNQCQYDEEEREQMLYAVKLRNKFPYPLLYCEGERYPGLEKRIVDGRKKTQFQVLGSHFEPDGYGAALVKIRTLAWRKECERLGHWTTEECDVMVMGIDAQQLKKADRRQRGRWLNDQLRFEITAQPKMMVDYFLIQLKREPSGELRPYWFSGLDSLRASTALADQLGDKVGRMRLGYYDTQYDLLPQDALDLQYMGVFYYVSPQELDFSPRYEAGTDIPLRKDVGGAAEVYRAVKGKREY